MLKRAERLIAKRKQLAEDTEALSGDEGERMLSDEEDEDEAEMDEMEEEEEEEGSAAAAAAAPTLRKNRVLTIASRGITARYRHLLRDLQQLLPHTRKEGKMDARDPLSAINELCELRTCTHAVYFDTRRHRDLYVSVARVPQGPTLRFFAHNVHTMDELGLTGNCLKGSRAVLSFDASFDAEPRWRLARELLAEIFAVPRGHPRSKPFIDHVFAFSVQDGRVWFRCYQIVEQGERDAAERALVEVGPRFALEPVRYFAGSFGGAVIYENEGFVSPNAAARAAKVSQAAAAAVERQHSKRTREEMAQIARRPPTEMDTLFH